MWRAPMAMNSSAIKSYLDRCGVKHSNLGFKYLVSVFMIVSAEADKNTVISEVYEKVAKKYNAAPKSVERAIRYSIKHHRVTNKEFVIRAIDKNFMDYEPERDKRPRKHKEYGLRV
jgi:hypothetical protein